MKSPKTTKKTTKKTPTKSTSKATETKATKTEQPEKAVASKAATKKPSPKKKAPAKEKKPAVVAKPTPDTTAAQMTIPDRVGSTAGSIWHYLTQNGTTPVAKLLREIEEDEKIIQRSIGWLAQEGKIILDTSGRGETITLKD